MSGSSPQASSQTQSATTTTSNAARSPWEPAQPYLQELMANAAGTAQAQTAQGYNPQNYFYNWNPNNTPGVSPDFHPWEATGLNWMYELARSEPYGSQNLQDARSYLDEIIQQRGLTPTVQQGLGTLGQAGGQFTNLYQTNIGTENPWLEQAISGRERQTADRIAGGMSGAGRYGSGQYTDVMARAMSEVADPVYAQDYATRMQLAQQATQGLGTVGQAVGAIGQQAVAQTGQAAQLVPTLDAARYASSQMAIQAGQPYSQLYNQNQQLAQGWPWLEMQRAANIIDPIAGLGFQQIGSGTGTGTTTGYTYPAPLAQRALGGAIAGAGLGSSFGPIGTGIGALGGAGLAFL